MKSHTAFRLLPIAAMLLILTACGYHSEKDMAGNYSHQGKQEAYYLDEQLADVAPLEAEPELEPVEHNREEYDRIKDNRFQSPFNAPLSTFSVDVDVAAYANMRRYLLNGSLPPADAVRTEELVNYFSYSYPAPTGPHPFSITTEVAPCPWTPQHQLVHIGLQGRQIPVDQLPASNLVFLIDVSGSMSDQNKLPLLVDGLSMLVEQLREQDRVAIVVYAGAAGLVLPSTSGSDKRSILKALNRLEAGGSTAGAAGIHLAYQVAQENFIPQGNNRVILATDGDFNVGESSNGGLERLIEEKRETGVFLSVLGFGSGNYQDSKMQTLAQAGNGNAAYIDSQLEAKKVLVEEFGGTMYTIAKDVKVQVEFNPEHVQAYRLIGYENRMLQAEDFNDDKKDAGEIGSGHTVTALYEVVPVGVDMNSGSVDPLRYQKPADESRVAKRSGELMTVKFRYKQPDGAVSQLITGQVMAEDARETGSENFRWSAAVAGFSLVLRDSEYKGDATYDQILELASGAQGADPNGYRSEFIGLVKRAAAIDRRAVAENED